MRQLLEHFIGGADVYVDKDRLGAEPRLQGLVESVGGEIAVITPVLLLRMCNLRDYPSSSAVC